MVNLLALSQNKAKAKAKAKKLETAELSRVVLAFTEALEEKELEQKELEMARVEKSQKAKELLALISDSGVTIDDLINLNSTKPKKPKSIVPPKYRAEIDGENVEWTGRGRIPTILKDYMERNGIEKEELLIK